MTAVIYDIWPELELLDDGNLIIYGGPVSPYALELVPINDVAKELNKLLKTKKIERIIVFNISEPLQHKPLHTIHRLLSKISFDPKNIIYTTASLDGTERYNEWCERQGYTDRITILAANEFGNATRGLMCTTPSEYIARIRPKNFVLLNKMERAHRIALIAEIIDNNLLDKGLVSFCGSSYDTSWAEALSQSYDDMTDTMVPTSPYRHISTPVAKIIKQNIDKFPMLLTGNKESRFNPIDIVDEDKYLFDDSYYSIITETLYYNTHRCHLSTNMVPGTAMLSEKAYKAIVMKHPFILVSTPGLLVWMRKLGYKTFHPYINEAYDNELDDDKRMDMIVKEVKRLSRYTDDEWMQWQKNVKDMVDHNYDVYINTTDFRITTI
jgi:hypothetical protein